MSFGEWKQTIEAQGLSGDYNPMLEGYGHRMDPVFDGVSSVWDDLGGDEVLSQVVNHMLKSAAPVRVWTGAATGAEMKLYLIEGVCKDGKPVLVVDGDPDPNRLMFDVFTLDHSES